MKQLKLTVNGNSEELSNLVSLVMKNPRLRIVGLSEDDIQPPENTAQNLEVGRPGIRDRWGHRKEAAFTYRNKKEVLDIETSCKNLGYTVEQLMSRSWKAGTLEHALKMGYGRRKD